jgi:hypothetical protein
MNCPEPAKEGPNDGYIQSLADTTDWPCQAKRVSGWYGLAESMDYEVQATVELHPANNKNGYAGRTLLDGMPLLEDAFVRLRMA